MSKTQIDFKSGNVQTSDDDTTVQIQINKWWLIGGLLIVAISFIWFLNRSVWDEAPEEVVPVATSSGATFERYYDYGIDIDFSIFDGKRVKHKVDVVVRYRGQRKELTFDEFFNKLGFEIQEVPYSKDAEKENK